ncbi:MAG TPA: RHS repeat-associated core domain-containing protein, partial [Gemmatimonadales bacterium]|nr:RHS repeat-associated core domain-containing protein [Gemmatimonadales bacterium]
ALKFDRQESLDDPQPTEAPIWTEQDGSGQPAKTMQDSVVYDGWGRVTTWLAFVNGSVVARDSVTFDRAGNIWTTAGAEAYDTTTDRLVSRAGGGCGTWQYTYDPMGDLIQAACGSPASITWTYGYDAARHLRTVTYNGTLVARYAYDVLGRRIAKRVYSNISGGIVAFTRFVYHRADVAFETDSSGSTGLRYTWGPATDDLLAIDDGSAHYLVVEDLLHSVRGLIRRDGTWIRAIRYKMYGATLRDTVSTVAPTWTLRYQWTGREYDGETGWYFFRARYYDPNVRRFVQEDPIGYGGGGNLYAYAAGGPLAARDPSGTKLSGDIDSCVGGNWNCPIRITTHGNLGYSDNWWENMDLQMQADDAVWSALDLQEVEKAIAEAQAELAIVLDSWQSQSRPLSDSENKALVSICESGFYCSDVHVTTGADNIFLDGCGGCSGITVGYNIYFRAPGDPSIPELAHELTHVWQFKQVFDENLVVYGEAFIGLHAWSQLTGQNPYHLDYPLKNLNWSSYGLEQQARIVQDCYASKANACSVSPWQP